MEPSKITEFTELTSVALDDVFPIVDDVSGVPTTKKVTLANLKAGLGLTGTNSGDQTLLTDATITTTDVTTNNASTSKHGWLPKLDNVSTNFLNGQGAWSAPSVGTGYLYSYKASDQTNIGTSFTSITNLGVSVAANGVYEFEFFIIADADAVTTGIDISCDGPVSPTYIIYEVTYWTSATAHTERCFTAYNGNTASTGSNGTAAKVFRLSGVLRNGANPGTLLPLIKREAVGTGPNVRAGSFGKIKQIS